MSLKSLYSFFCILLKVKFSLKRIKKIPIVIYDEYTEIINDFLKPEQYYVLDVRFKSINLRILAKSLIIYKFKWKPKFYLITFLSELNPSYIITFIDNDVRFWNIKKYLKTTETVFVQNGWRDSSVDIFSTLSPKDHNCFKVDKMFVFNTVIGNEYKKYISGDVYPIGSYRNNSFEIGKKLCNDGVVFISNYTPEWKNLSNCKKLANYQGLEKILFALLCKIFREKKIKLSVLGKQDSGFSEIEEKFYKQIDNNFIFIPMTKEKRKNYRHVDASKLVVSLDSTLGYESLARGNRTAFLTIRSQDLKNKSHNFGWPNKFQDLGPFWINYYDEFYIRKIIDYLLNISDNEWNTETKKYINKIMIYDSGNETLKKYIKEIEFKTN